MQREAQQMRGPFAAQEQAFQTDQVRRAYQPSDLGARSLNDIVMGIPPTHMPGGAADDAEIYGPLLGMGGGETRDMEELTAASTELRNKLRVYQQMRMEQAARQEADWLRYVQSLHDPATYAQANPLGLQVAAPLQAEQPLAPPALDPEALGAYQTWLQTQAGAAGPPGFAIRPEAYLQGAQQHQPLQLEYGPEAMTVPHPDVGAPYEPMRDVARGLR
jgi:hypothetical protein